MTRPLQDTEVRPDHDTRAYHDFLRATKRYWSTRLYTSVREAFERRNAAVSAGNADEAERAMREEPVYRFFGWLERHQQRLKYAAPRGILAAVEAERSRITAMVADALEDPAAARELRLDPSLALPPYYQAVEFHQHPGGVWRDPLAGFAYDFGRQTTMPAHGDPDEIHRRVAAASPDGDFTRVLDIGCGTGRSTLPLCDRYPRAEVFGIDLSEPCLVRAWLRSRAAGKRVQWSQQLAERTDFEDGSFDLVHSTFLLHEVPTAALRVIVGEAYRLLRPGGWFVSLDFQDPPGGVFGRFIHYGHARRNDEVFMRAFCDVNLLAMQREAGFRVAEMRPFDDGSGLWRQEDRPPVWRFPSQLFVARK